MPTLGEELKRRREERQIALTDISEATRIGTRFLKAIEMDNYGVLPGGIFTRSFIRAFAKQVGMDEDEAIGLYQQQVAGVSAEAAPQQRIESPAPTIVEPPRPTKSRPEPLTYTQSGPRLNWTTIVIGGGITIFLIVIVLAVIQKLKSPAQEPAPTRSAVTANSNAAATSSSAANANSNTAPASSETSPSSTPPVTQGEPLVVKFEATTDNCSVRYWIDDSPKSTDVMVRKGESQTLPPAQTQIRLNIANRPAIKMSINNREAKFPEGTGSYPAKVTITRDTLQTFFQ
jgi:cytoskeletal protein RodZ